MTALDVAKKLEKLHIENIVHSKVYVSRIAKYRGKPITPCDEDKLESFITIAAMTFGLDDVMEMLMSIVELDVLRTYNEKIYKTIDQFKNMENSILPNYSGRNDSDFFIFFLTNRFQ